MRKTGKAVLVLSSISLASLISATAFAAAWQVPTNVRMVQKSNSDTTGRVYGTIQAAINSIGSSATATNPYVVKVGPGVYNETVTMKPYVDVVGSGRGNTIIKAAVINSGFDTCTAAPVLMASNSSLKDLKVVNNTAGAGDDNLAAGVIFNNIKATAENIDILVGDDAIHTGRSNGVCIVGASGHAVLNDVNIETHNNSGDSNAVLTIEDGSMTITNSKLVGMMSGSPSGTHVVDCYGGVAMTGTASITNTYIESTWIGSGGEGGYYSALWLNDCTATVANSNVKLNNPAGDGIGLDSGSLPFTLTNVQLNVPAGSTAVQTWGNSGKIANSLIGGAITGDTTNLKLINNYDQNFNPVANQ